LAFGYLNRGRNNDASTYAARAVEIDPTNSEGWIVLGAGKSELGDRKAAKEAYRKCVELGRGPYVAECKRMVRCATLPRVRHHDQHGQRSPALAFTLRDADAHTTLLDRRGLQLATWVSSRVTASTAFTRGRPPRTAPAAGGCDRPLLGRVRIDGDSWAPLRATSKGDRARAPDRRARARRNRTAGWAPPARVRLCSSRTNSSVARSIGPCVEASTRPTRRA
jgi:hypothetical protein